VPSSNFDNSIPIDNAENYGFQAVATNMRGFKQNIRNGNSFALINTELRVPLFQYLLNKPIRSDFIRNFQIVTFFDLGTAWTGDSPYSNDNSFNTEVINGNPVTVILDRQVDPIVAGFGGGLRSRVFGYFLRADWGWGYEDGVVRDMLFNLSLGLDF
jgi:outer membrane protein assembly factor BamA